MFRLFIGKDFETKGREKKRKQKIMIYVEYIN